MIPWMNSCKYRPYSHADTAMRHWNSCLFPLRILCQYLLSISFVIVVYRDRLFRTCVLALLTSQMRRRNERTRAKTFRGAARRRSLRVGSRSTAIFIYDVNKPLSGRITSAVAVCALLGHDGCDASATAAQQQRSGWVAAEQRQHDINHAHAHKFTMSLALSRLPCAVYLACTTGTGIAPSRSQCFIAAGYALLLASSSCARTHTGTHTGALRHSAHSLRAKGRRKERERERKSSCLCVKHMLALLLAVERKGSN